MTLIEREISYHSMREASQAEAAAMDQILFAGVLNRKMERLFDAHERRARKLAKASDKAWKQLVASEVR
jgi:hypothetical protein